MRLAAKLSLGAYLSRNARHFTGKGVELIDHRIDSIFQLEDFALHVDSDFSVQVATRYCGGDFCDVAYLGSEVSAHGVHRICKILPGACYAGNHRLNAKATFGANLARNTSDFGSERAELLDHCVNGFLELQNLPTHIDRDLFRKIAVGNSNGYICNVSHLPCKIRGHGVHVIGEIFPRAGDTRHGRLATKLAFGADLAGHARHFRRKGTELLDHGVHRFLELQNFALHIDRNLAAEVPLCDRCGHVCDIPYLASEVGGHRIHVVG